MKSSREPISRQEFLKMKSPGEQARKTWWHASSQQWNAFLREPDEQVFLLLTLLIGAIQYTTLDCSYWA